MTSKSTPGPWHISSEELRGGMYWTVARGEDKEAIDIHADDNGEADARLIAAAPDLLAAAHLVRKCGNGGAKLSREASDAIRAAIAKATGGAGP